MSSQLKIGYKHTEYMVSISQKMFVPGEMYEPKVHHKLYSFWLLKPIQEKSLDIDILRTYRANGQFMKQHKSQSHYSPSFFQYEGESLMLFIAPFTILPSIYQGISYIIFGQTFIKKA